jgi:rSAM/selenodomain-associated transferase 2
MNAGAAAATGDILLFLHVDTVLPKGFHDIVRRAVEERGAIGGCFSFALDGKRAFYRFIEKTANFRSRRMGVVFGDQAIFVRKEAFFEAGGYPLLPVMEDSALVDGIRKKGSFVQLEERAVTSARRWERSGALRTTLVNVLITWAWRLGVAPARLKRWYEVLAGGRS